LLPAPLYIEEVNRRSADFDTRMAHEDWPSKRAYTSNGKMLGVLAQENDEAFALLNAVDETQRKQVILNYRADDLVLARARQK
jgi:hypothetical protein